MLFEDRVPMAHVPFNLIILYYNRSCEYQFAGFSRFRATPMLAPTTVPVLVASGCFMCAIAGLRTEAHAKLGGGQRLLWNMANPSRAKCCTRTSTRVYGRHICRQWGYKPTNRTGGTTFVILGDEFPKLGMSVPRGSKKIRPQHRVTLQTLE